MVRGRGSRRLVGFALGLAICLSAGGALAAAPLTGDPNAIKIAHAVQQAFTRVSSYTVTERRFVFMRARAGAHGYFDWNWGVGSAPAGWVRATERELVVTHHGRVVWMRDNISPDASHCNGQHCVRYPHVQVLVVGTGQYFRFQNTSCYYRLSGTVPLHPGDPAYRIAGFMLDPGYQRKQVLLNYDYQWDAHRWAGETDVVLNATTLVSSGQVDLSAYGSEPSFIFAFWLGYPGGHLRAPHVALCRA